MKILFHADAGGPRQWLLAAKERLGVRGHEVLLARRDEAPRSRSLLTTCERVDRFFSGRSGAGLAARLDGDALSPFLRSVAASNAASGVDVEVGSDFVGEGSASGADRLRLQILFDGAPGDEVLFAALLGRRSPLIEVACFDSGRVLARGVASLEAARSLMGAADAVYARVLTLLQSAVEAHEAGGKVWATGGERPSARELRASDVARQVQRGLVNKAVRTVYEAACHFPHWRVGWRFNSGGRVWDTASLDGAPWQVLPDPGDHFYADPFPMQWGGRRMILFEDLDHRSGRGIISAVDVRDDGSTGPVIPVLEEPWHLSYPFMVEDGGQLWMIPESSACRTVDLYRAEAFPDRWVKEATLLSGIEASDATIFRHGGVYWMTASVRDGFGAHSDTLSLFTAPALTGPWVAHSGNPVLVDARSARPAGNVVVRNGTLWRPAQVCDQSYGAALVLCEVTRLDETGFAQEVRHVLRPGPMWPGRRLHTLNEAFGISCIDGGAVSLKSPPLARWLAPWSLRRSGDEGVAS